MKAEVVEDKIWEGSYVKFLGVAIDSRLNFDSYFSSIYLKANQKLSALSILAKLLPFARIDYFLKHFLNLNSNIVLWYGYSVMKNQIRGLINFMMIHSVYITQTFKHF